MRSKSRRARRHLGVGFCFAETLAGRIERHLVLDECHQVGKPTLGARNIVTSTTTKNRWETLRARAAMILASLEPWSPPITARPD
jgi:hypothetical protein